MNEKKFILTKSLVLFMALICGVSVASLYYVQPLLSEIAATFSITQSSAGIIATLTQMGYALGLFFLVPLGDIKERRSLIIRMLVLVTVSLLAVSFSPNYTLILLASLVLGFTTIVPQIIIPYAAHLASPKERGKTLGIVTSGLLIGILLSRTFSGLVGSVLGWRIVYIFAAILSILLTILVRKLLPESAPSSSVNYKKLLSSMWPLVKGQKVLREAAINGALMFGSFSALWTTLIFLLQTPNYKMGTREAGLFGLIGVVGALAAPVIGKFADKKSPRYTVGIGILCSTSAYLCFRFFGFKLFGLILGIILLDLGNQNGQVSNQARIQALGDEFRSRNNTIFMVSYFIGGSLGSFLGTLCWQNFGWYGVCTLGLTFQVLALISHFIIYRTK